VIACFFVSVYNDKKSRHVATRATSGVGTMQASRYVSNLLRSDVDMMNKRHVDAALSNPRHMHQSVNLILLAMLPGHTT
jgi:hypothetical protein